jgi:putative ABC transport system permease protein
MNLIRDLRVGTRVARRSPLISLGGILCIAIGIGATTALYSVLEHVVISPLAYPEPRELVLVRETNRATRCRRCRSGRWRRISTARCR